MGSKPFDRLFSRIDFGMNLMKEESYRLVMSSILTRCRTLISKAEKPERDDLGKKEDKYAISSERKHIIERKYESGNCGTEDISAERKWKLELDWLPKVLEPALQLFRSAVATGSSGKHMVPPTDRSLTEILSSLQRSKIGIQHWTIGDLTVGLYLIYLHQASADKIEDVKGTQISSDSLVQDLIYHVELAKGAYKENASGLARNSMILEKNVVKFVKNSSVLRPGYYIGIDIHNKLIIFGIRGTHTVYDLITDMISSSDQGITFEGFSTHFGTGEAALWFLHHEMQTIRECLEKHKGFRLRLVGHSLGGAVAALFAIMIRQRSIKELGFDPKIVSAIGFGTPPCVSKELAESCASYVSNVVLQDDVIPRLSTTSLTRLRNEILQTDWISVLEKEDWKSFVDLVTNARQVVSSVQDVARKLADYTKFSSKNTSGNSTATRGSESALSTSASAVMKEEVTSSMSEELFVPGTVYFIRRKLDSNGSNKGTESYTLWEREAGHHFRRIVLSGNFMSDHKCDNHYYALRDVLKGIPKHDDR